MKQLSTFIDVMSYTEQIAHLVSQIPLPSRFGESVRPKIEQEYLSAITERLSNLYSEQELEELNSFFSQDTGKAYLAKQKDVFADSDELIRNILEKVLNSGQGDPRNMLHFRNE